MTKIGIMMSANSAAPIIFFVAIDNYFFRQKRISVAYNGGNIKIIANITTDN
jgi:hypothetical protein